MTATTHAPASTRPPAATPRGGTTPSRHGMRGLGGLIASETRMFVRDTGNLFFVVLFPSVLFIGMGFAIPGMRDTITGAPEPFLGLRAVDIFTPVMLCVAVATAALTTVAAYLASYREAGVLRRMRTTPLRPQGILVAQVVVQLAGVTAGSALALLAGWAVFGVPMPQQPLVALVAFLLAVAAMFAIGVLIGGLADKATTASGIGMLIYFPMLFLAGLWTPGPLMPDAVERVAAYSPLGAASQALQAGWFDGGIPWLQLGVMAAWAVGVFWIAARTFKWE